MGKLSIHCGGCGSDWIVYHRDDWKNWKSRTCPVCGKSIDPGTWERSVLMGFGEMEDANIELMKDHTQSHGTLFTVSYLPDVVSPNHSDDLDCIREGLENLNEGLDNLREVMTKFIDSLFSI